jgi:cytochrome c oxidase cbb3-type subunit 2
MVKQIGFIVTALGILAFAAMTLVLIPSIQLSRQPAEEALREYSPQELKGRWVYIESGCMYCHSQQPRDPSFGSDQARNWGRASTPGDYAYDFPHLLGTMRTGPDLLNIGVRQPSDDWHLLHLYQPRAVLPESLMPAFPYLFQHKSVVEAGERIVTVPERWISEKHRGKKVVAGQKVLDLVAYLKSLRRVYPSTQRPIKEKKTHE